MSVYYVEQCAVYRHGVLGIFATEAEARARAEAVTHEGDEEWFFDGDGHHHYEVYRTELGDTGGGVLVAVYKAPEMAYKGRADYQWQEAR
jgi:hypothetical protein